ncbi:unnamed protein product [Lepeophtheirus salmonis]|uniref:(salmon louse) hypothetical protein n=1 Tax=Lepeophtheirus salmonis TaxID=72036 RepID=A0A817FC56_LEPSM|nr:unnamed protein product [Lepeophtheirus salmonis]CAG9476554.1 unnamed protein product [Lepeophtheirus salmonis]
METLSLNASKMEQKAMFLSLCTRGQNLSSDRPKKNWISKPKYLPSKKKLLFCNPKGLEDRAYAYFVVKKIKFLLDLGANVNIFLIKFVKLDPLEENPGSLGVFGETEESSIFGNAPKDRELLKAIEAARTGNGNDETEKAFTHKKNEFSLQNDLLF